MGASDKAVAEKAAQVGQVASLNIYQRMHAVMKELSYLRKDQEKKVNGQYSYVSHDQVAGAVRPLLVQHGIVCFPRMTGHKQDGNRLELDIELTFVNIDNPEDKLVIPSLGYAHGTDDKLPGKALSYAVKFAMLKAFCIETGDKEDIEREHIDHKPGLVSDEQLESLAELALDVGAHIPSFCKFLKINDLSELPAAKYDTAIKALESKRKMMSKQPATIEGEQA